MLSANMTGPTCPSTWGESQLCPKKGSSLHFAIVTATPCCHTSGLTSSSSWQSPSGRVNLSLRHYSCPLHTPLSSKLTASPQSSSFLGPSLPQLGPPGIITRFTQPSSATMTDHANPPARAISASERLLTGSTETPHFGRVWTTQLTSALHHTPSDAHFEHSTGPSPSSTSVGRHELPLGKISPRHPRYRVAPPIYSAFPSPLLTMKAS